MGKESDRAISKLITLDCVAEYNCYSLTGQSCSSVVSLEAPQYDPSLRSPVHIVAVIDKSQSMKFNIELVKKALKFVISQCEYIAIIMCIHVQFINWLLECFSRVKMHI